MFGKAGWSARLGIFLFTDTLVVLGNGSTVPTGCAGMDIPLCFIFFFFFWPWKFVALNVTGLRHYWQLLRPMRAKPHLPDTRLMPIRTASISVYACVYIDIYKEREIFMNLFFSYFVTRTINKKQTEKNKSFLVEHCHVILKGSVCFLGSRLWILVVD